ncbi:MAG: hypothetical protein AAF565_19380, partial [Pseudomonadota bacterium]
MADNGPARAGINLSNVFSLGPISIRGDADPDTVDLTLGWRPLEAAADREGVDLFDALTWRHRLTPSLIGRATEMHALLAWAEDGCGGISVRLMSGPAGIGKTRLAAEAATALIGRGWTAGFLARAQDRAEHIRVEGRGLFMILDYPEERRALVDRLLDRLSDRAPTPEQTIRILLVSRKGPEAWEETAERLGSLFSRQEIATPAPLSDDDALDVLTEAATRFAVLTEARVPDLSAARAWLATAPTHRRPLYAAASGVRAVAAESARFDYGAADLMRWLAGREIARVRRISRLAGLGRTDLERLLALALATPEGLGKSELRRLGSLGVAEKADTALLNTVADTPWWQRPTAGGAPRLLRLEPDQPAAAFLEAALLADPDPRLPDWLAVPAEGAGGEFGKILARLAFDLATLDPEASRAAEQAALEMLDRTPALAETLRPVAMDLATAFSARFAAAVATRLLATATEPAERAPLLL